MYVVAGAQFYGIEVNKALARKLLPVDGVWRLSIVPPPAAAEPCSNHTDSMTNVVTRMIACSWAPSRRAALMATCSLWIGGTLVVHLLNYSISRWSIECFLPIYIYIHGTLWSWPTKLGLWGFFFPMVHLFSISVKWAWILWDKEIKNKRKNDL